MALDNFLIEYGKQPTICFEPRRDKFTAVKRDQVYGIATLVNNFLRNVIRRSSPDLTALQSDIIAEAYKKFSSRSDAYPHKECHLGPRSLRMNPMQILL